MYLHRFIIGGWYFSGLDGTGPVLIGFRHIRVVSGGGDFAAYGESPRKGSCMRKFSKESLQVRWR